MNRPKTVGELMARNELICARARELALPLRAVKIILGEEFSMGPDNVALILKEQWRERWAGVEPSRGIYPADDARAKKIIEASASYATLEETAKALGITRQRVQQVLRAHGVKSPMRVLNERGMERAAKIRKLFSEGESVEGLSEAFGIWPYKIRHVLGIGPIPKSSTRQTRERALEILGGKCVSCGFSDIRALQIDHIHGNGCAERDTSGGNYSIYKKIVGGDTDGYQVLCANCNWIKRADQGEFGREYGSKKRNSHLRST
jgi:AraC-like DNA-binding protein